VDDERGNGNVRGLDFALEMEINGKAHYEKLADCVCETALKPVFIDLAADELKHYNTIMAIKMGIPWLMTDSTIMDEFNRLFDTMIADPTVAGILLKALEDCHHARKMEAESVRIYEDLVKTETSSINRQLLRRMADDERKHYNMMGNLYDFAQTPKIFMAWKRFDNHKIL